MNRLAYDVVASARWCRRRSRLAAGVTAVLAVGAVATALAQGSRDSVVPYPAGGQALYGVRPTAVGLPDLRTSGTLLVTGLVKAFRSYHDTGQYARDLAAVDGAAERYLDQRLATARLSGKPAIVLDIDETALSNYADLSAHDFGFCFCGLRPDGTAIQPTLRLYRDALAHRVAVFFVTGRPPVTGSITRLNLRRVGYSRGWAGLYEKPVSAKTAQFKSSARARIQQAGYDIIANVGDQQSDLDGGHADRQFKLPDPFYFVSD